MSASSVVQEIGPLVTSAPQGLSEATSVTVFARGTLRSISSATVAWNRGGCACNIHWGLSGDGGRNNPECYELCGR